ncbi:MULTISPECIES: polysaccharide lyase family 1 protein [unclassified Streptomyces]|uniref:pectate lyase family protein n=1 Tax=Streptomyces TaxID=1883 RepID=UPI0001C18A4D|nr:MULTISPECIES: polysaccharide lyase family 1 protein [unclassified Streptomyces]AEN09222.1 Pectate lyase/Amb allergen [Streptomyces sp. SirexAA-E]MYR68552.1 pectate lyase [Streptomyces sp. SID4939]MYR99474.1 pectate lyase [Streptomyces sp. SID4940]MYT64919.1 pectate lyase [Streptomyces sp. SID8357]MYT87535.1 pectate lyase [Streptomyces sp. SID8360]
MRITSLHSRRGRLTALAAVAVAALAVGTLPGSAGAAESAPVGFGAGTTGGGSASAVTVSTLAAFTSAVSGDSAKTVKVSGLITLSGQVDVGSNTTVLGVGSSSGFTGGGLRLKGESNIVIRNLNISKPLAPSDGITVQNSTRVWIDHNSFFADRDHDKDYYDGLLDITHASDDVTVSWNTFKNHYKGSLVGHSDSNASEDTGHLHVTYHHNHFQNVYSRIPSLRFGTGHFYDNYVQGADTAVHSRMGAQMLVENNVFRDTKIAITTSRSSKEDGYVVQRGNDLGGAATEISRTGSFSTPPYAYTAEPASSVVASVTSGAGAGKI